MKRIEFRYKYFSNKKSSEKEDKKENNEDLKDLAKVAAGTSLLYGGTKLIKKNKSKITGLENFYHSADEGVIDSIKKNGLKAEYSEDPENLTNTILGGTINKSKLKGKVYLGRKKSVADGVGNTRDLNYRLGKIKNKSYKGKSKTLKVNIPYEELKKMKEVDNPELRGAKNTKEFAKGIWKNAYKNAPESAKQLKETFGKTGRNAFARILSEATYGKLSKEGTAVFENNIDSKFIKGSDKYKRYSIEQFKDYVKKNPKRFAKGVGKGAVGVGMGITGAILLKNALSDKKKKKERNKRKEED